MVSIFLLLVVVVAAKTAVTSAVSLALGNAQGPNNRPMLPTFLDGKPENEEIHKYSPGVEVAPHTAHGRGLYHARAGVPTSFKILLADEDDAPPHDQWNAVNNRLFMYVWIANADQIFIAEVVNNGDGTLTAAYESSFPGNYSVHIEVVTMKNHDQGVPIVGSPFGLQVQGNPELNIDKLPVCGAEEEDIESSFWRSGTWVSSNLASASHGVMRDGWVFQPKSCVYDMFSYEDLMLLAERKEPTWILILGGSVQRGVFLNLVDMALAKGQKDNFQHSAIGKCWGYADIKIGNLRLTYQDFRLYTITGFEDTTVCNNEKLQSGSSAAFVRSCKNFLQWKVFAEGEDWPSVIMAPSNMINSEGAANVAIEVIMAALPGDWRGTLVMVEHMAGFGLHWGQRNPTAAALEDVGMSYHRKAYDGDGGYGKMSRYQQQDPRTTFMSVFPMYQSKLYENQNTQFGKRWYGGSQHFHYMTSNSSVEAHGGAKMVHSTITEMISNILIGKAVGTKQVFYADLAIEGNAIEEGTSVRDSFMMCTDCPSGLLPFHVEPNPKPVCVNISALPGNAKNGEVWDNTLCPKWCLAMEPVSQTPTESGPVDVRSCSVPVSPP